MHNPKGYTNTLISKDVLSLFYQTALLSCAIKQMTKNALGPHNGEQPFQREFVSIGREEEVISWSTILKTYHTHLIVSIYLFQASDLKLVGVNHVILLKQGTTAPQKSFILHPRFPDVTENS